MSKLDEAKRLYWSAKVMEAQKKARIAAWAPVYAGLWGRIPWRAIYRAELRRIMAEVKL